MEALITAMAVIIAIWAGCRTIRIRKQIKAITAQLAVGVHKQVTMELVDGGLEELAVEINGLTEEIRRVKAQAEKNSMRLRQSVAEISHDMRTPLTSVIGYLQLARQDCTESGVKENLTIALERADYLSRIINDFFELSVMETENSAPVFEQIDLADLLCEQILACWPDFNRRGIGQRFEGADEPVFIHADRKMTERIVQNLISNSLKYAAGDVEYRIGRDKEVTLSVTNPVEKMDIDTEHIFDRFYRGENSRGGNGLGLYLVKLLAEKNNARPSACLDERGLTVSVTFEDGLCYCSLRDQ